MKLIIKSLAIVSLFVNTVTASGYPEKEIEIVVASKANGSTDKLAKEFIKAAKRHLPTANFKITNKAGEAGLLGFNYIKSAPADGYTIGLIFTPHFLSHITSSKANYKLSDFTALGKLSDDPNIIVVNIDSEIKTVEDFLKLSKERPLAVAVNGIGSDDFLAAKDFEHITKIEYMLAMTDGSTEQKEAVLEGYVEAAFMNLSQMLEKHKEKKVRILATLTENRVIDTIPAVKDSGYTVLMTATRGFVVNSKVPDDVKLVLTKLVQDVALDTEFKKSIEALNISLDYATPEDYMKYLLQLKENTDNIFARYKW